MAAVQFRIPVFSKNREKKKKKRDEKEEENITVWQQYTRDLQLFPVLHIFVAKCCKYSVFEGLGKQKWREKEEKKMPHMQQY